MADYKSNQHDKFDLDFNRNYNSKYNRNYNLNNDRNYNFKNKTNHNSNYNHNYNSNKRKEYYDCQSQKRFRGNCETVAKHYNNRDELGLEKRQSCKIIQMRNYNNWIKSMLISDAIDAVKSDGGNKISVLDLCSGKGGDLLKWKIGGIDKLTCVDIAENSVKQCKVRYDDLVKRSCRDRGPLFTSRFVSADCSKTSLKRLLRNTNEQYDITSCQFALHYSFESLLQVEMMLKNACECLKPGGLFIGTIPNADVLVEKLRQSEGKSFGNGIYKVEFEIDDKERIPKFGAKYNFFLEESINCPEFLVNFSLLEDLAAKEGMELVTCNTFEQFYEMKSKTEDGQKLMKKMMTVEPIQPGNKRDVVPMLSKDEWDATNLYRVFVFRKVR